MGRGARGIGAAGGRQIGAPGNQHGSCCAQEDLFDAFQTGVAAGCNWFDTAEVRAACNGPV